jgi:hypothetical protein
MVFVSQRYGVGHVEEVQWDGMEDRRYRRGIQSRFAVLAFPFQKSLSGLKTRIEVIMKPYRQYTLHMSQTLAPLATAINNKRRQQSCSNKSIRTTITHASTRVKLLFIQLIDVLILLTFVHLQ